MASLSRTLVAIVALSSAPLLNAAPARAQDFAIAGQVGTTGLGGGVVVGLMPKINIRAMYGIVPSGLSVEVDLVNFELDFPSFLLMTVDLYPFGALHLSVGGLLITKGGDLNVVGTFDGVPVDFAGTTYTGSVDDRLTGTFSLKSFQPYLGIGIGNPLGKRLSINFDVGVGLGEQPAVELIATGTLAEAPAPVGPAFLADLEQHEDAFEASIPDYLRYYPVLSVSVSIGF